MTAPPPNPFRIVIADDEPDSILLTKNCFLQSKMPVKIEEVSDGQQLTNHLKTFTEGADPQKIPQLIILDLNMPKKGGLEALAEIKNNALLRKIPVIIFSKSRTLCDVERSYELGASCFISKPDTQDEWCEKIQKLGKFWIECVRVFK